MTKFSDVYFNKVPVGVVSVDEIGQGAARTVFEHDLDRALEFVILIAAKNVGMFETTQHLALQENRLYVRLAIDYTI